MYLVILLPVSQDEGEKHRAHQHLAEGNQQHARKQIAHAAATLEVAARLVYGEMQGDTRADLAATPRSSIRGFG